MKRLIGAGIILLLIFAAFFAEKSVIDGIKAEMTDKIELTISAVKSDDFSDAKIYASEFYDAWGKKKKYAAALLPHEITDEISTTAARLKSFSAADGKDDALAAAMELKELISELADKRKITISNILTAGVPRSIFRR